jgi:hypothetical protein
MIISGIKVDHFSINIETHTLIHGFTSIQKRINVHFISKNKVKRAG